MYAVGLLRAVNRVLSSGTDIPHAVWYLTVTLESLCPAVGIALFTSSHSPQGYQPLATPWALAFFPFILLSVLPLFVYNAETRTFRCLHAQAVPLGIVPEMDGAIPVALEMKPGDLVLLITDGFFEWQNRKEEQFGAERIAAVVGQFSDHEPEIIIAELYDAVLKFSQGTPQKDDLTAVLIKRVALQAWPIEMVAAAERKARLD
jgi:hypothetical protein